MLTTSEVTHYLLCKNELEYHINRRYHHLMTTDAIYEYHYTLMVIHCWNVENWIITCC